MVQGGKKWAKQDGSLNIRLQTAGGLNTFVVGGAYKLPLNTWCLLAFTYDGSYVRIYLNGNLAGSMAATGNVDYGNNGAWMVGGRQSGAGYGAPGQYFDGCIDDVRIENTVRSAAYLTAMYQKMFSGITYVDQSGNLVYQSPNGRVSILGAG